MVLPTFFVIGAPKCGTTSLHNYLAEHPEIAMTTVKEPFVFSTPDYRDRARVYEELFPRPADVRGESSAVYAHHPRYGDVPARIEALVPAARFLYLVRDPIDRAIAHYEMHVADGKDPRAVDEALSDYDAPDSIYVGPSRYRTQLEQYLARFPAESILVLDQDELRERPEHAMAEAYGFLGVGAGFHSPAFAERWNVRADQMPLRRGGEVARRAGAAATARRVLPRRARRRVRRVLTRRRERPSLAPELRDAIADSLRDEVAWLRDFTGRPFAGWSL